MPKETEMCDKKVHEGLDDSEGYYINNDIDGNEEF